MLETQLTPKQAKIIDVGFKSGQSLSATSRYLKATSARTFTRQALRRYLDRQGLWEFGWTRPEWARDIHGQWHQISHGTKK